MNTTGNETLERIQREIKENLEKEEEWKRELEKMSNGYSDLENNNSQKDNKNLAKVNGKDRKSIDHVKVTQNNNINKFVQNVKTRGVMQRFLKSKGKSFLPKQSSVTNGNIQVPISITDFEYQPPKITSETGTLSRNGFIPAEVKIRNEVQDFQKREIELRKERRRSQPELMALLKIEDEVNHSKEETFPEYSCSSSTSSMSEMKSAKSLADLCNTPEEELDAPGTFNLIKQFESLKSN